MVRAPVEKVAIVGGGMSALTAAFALTDPEQGGRYDVTVYQIGWRLGGKGASGRNRTRNDRIEEHGLHVWFGCYDNAFDVMRRCYDELGRPAGAPLRTLDEAFRPHDQCVFEERVGGEWIPWRKEFGVNDRAPGSFPTPWGYIVEVVRWLADALHGWHGSGDRSPRTSWRRSCSTERGWSPCSTSSGRRERGCSARDGSRPST